MLIRWRVEMFFFSIGTHYYLASHLLQIFKFALPVLFHPIFGLDSGSDCIFFLRNFDMNRKTLRAGEFH